MTTYVKASNGPIERKNPFEITKAVDFSDVEINRTWVDWPAPGGFASWFDISSPMPRILRGGKGTGRTHVMRHFSARVQAIRGGDSPMGQIVKDGVLGIYVRCSGLHSSRFRGSGLDNDTWQSIFCQFADVWLAQAALEAFRSVTAESPPCYEVESEVTQEVRSLLHSMDVGNGASLADLSEDLYKIQRRIDVAVNNAPLYPHRPLDLAIHSTLGTLVFGIPDALRKHFRAFRDIQFLYLVDEFENFDELQQQYIHSLLRDKVTGTSFMIGVRTSGLRTFKTLGGYEENRHGSEFEEIRPERNFVGAEKVRYGNFCRGVVERRLSVAGLFDEVAARDFGDKLNDFFELPPSDYVEQEIIGRYGDQERPYLARLKRQLLSNLRSAGIRARDVDQIVDATRVASRPLLEKVNIFLIYRAWASGSDLIKEARTMLDARASQGSSEWAQPGPAQRSILSHFVTDMKAQLLHDMRRRQTYAGISEFIEMTDGLPRNLLVILKNIYRWALFNGEEPFQGSKISIESQRLGVLAATDWFFDDAKPLGKNGEIVQAAIVRLGDLFRLLRFSDKPVESSLASFSADLTTCSNKARHIIELAVQGAMLVRVDRGEKDRNTGFLKSKFHLNRLLSPRWDLPIARRGTVALRSEEVNAIFDPEYADRFVEVIRRRLTRMNAPFNVSPSQSAIQETLELNP